MDLRRCSGYLTDLTFRAITTAAWTLGDVFTCKTFSYNSLVDVTNASIRESLKRMQSFETEELNYIKFIVSEVFFSHFNIAEYASNLVITSAVMLL